MSARPDDRLGGYSGKEFQQKTGHFWIDFALKDAVPEAGALKLLREIYHWFGIRDEQIPYVDSAPVPQRVHRAWYA